MGGGGGGFDTGGLDPFKTGWNSGSSGIQSPFNTIFGGGGGDDFWGSSSTNDLNATAPWQQEMQKVYSENLKNYAGSARPLLETMLQQGPNTVGNSSTINPQTTLNYFMDTAYRPAMKQLNEATLPGIRESMGKNYWSTARRNAEQNAMQSTANNLSQQLASLQYQDEQARRQMADVTQARNLQELGRWEANRLNQLQMYDPLYAQHFAPVSTAHTIDYAQQYNPGIMDRLGQIMGTAGQGAMTYRMLAGV